LAGVPYVFAGVAQQFGHGGNPPRFDDVIGRFADIMGPVEKSGRQRFPDRFDGHELVIAGWSDKNHRPEVYLEAGHGLGTAVARGVLYRADGPLLGGPVTDLGRAVAVDPEAFDPERDGVPIFEAMRSMRLRLDETQPDTAVGHGVGGFVELVTITRDGVEREIIHRWPDRVGEKIAA
jgi:hypothetical protein